MFSFDWTDIKLGLPKEKGKYLVTIDEGRRGTAVEIADFDGKDFYQCGSDDQEYGLTYCILAWCQLPEPYLKGGEDDDRWYFPIHKCYSKKV